MVARETSCSVATSRYLLCGVTECDCVRASRVGLWVSRTGACDVLRSVAIGWWIVVMRWLFVVALAGFVLYFVIGSWLMLGVACTFLVAGYFLLWLRQR